MQSYPKVVGEVETLDQLLAGRSITRFGDGEFRLAGGGSQNVSQVNCPRLQAELQEILVTKQDHCMVAIPTMDERSPNWGAWKKYINKYPKFLSDNLTYYSAFISRPDSAPWIDNADYFDKMESLWAGKTVVLVRGSERSFVEARPPMHLAQYVFPIMTSRRDAYEHIDKIQNQILQTKIKIAVLCAGAMATVLAYRLSKQGIQALDLGHAGYLWRRYDNAKHKQRTAQP